MAQDWGKTDTALLTGALTLWVVDWGQTRDIATRTDTHTVNVVSNGQPVGTFTQSTKSFHEKNSFLGENPSRKEVDRYFLAMIAGTAGLAYVLPQQPRRWFLGGVVVLESIAVYENHRIGVRISF